MASWAIVGGGILGSSIALRLADAGEQVTLIEAASELGGLASAWALGPIVWDRHYHVTLASDMHTRALLGELGLEDDLSWVTTRTGMWFDGAIHSMSDVGDYLRFPGLSLAAKMRLGWTIWSASRTNDWKMMETQPVEEWLRKRSGDVVFERFWLPLLKSKLGDGYTGTSAAFIWATIQRLYSARSSGSKTESFGYVPGGYSRILDRLQSTLVERGIELRLGSRVEAISAGPRVSIGGSDTDYDHVVVTAAPSLAARLISDSSDEERDRYAAIKYQGIVCASVLTRRSLSGFYLTYLYEDAPFTAVVEMSAFVDPAEFGGHSLVYLPSYRAPDDPLFDEADDVIRDRFLAGLRQVYPDFDPDDVVAFRISKVRNVFPVPTLGYSGSVPAFDTSVEGVHLVCSAQIVNGTLNVNDTLSLAERAISHLLGSTSRVKV